MGHLKIIVDHEKLEYSGPLDVKDLLNNIENFIWGMGYDKKQEKDTEISTQNGKHIEWQYAPWKKITDYIRYIVKVRVIGYDIVKTDVAHEGKKKKIDTGRIVIVIDGFMEYDYDNYWDDHPVLHFIRTIYDYFIFKAYTENFEQRLVHDVNSLHDHLEKFFNMHRHYTVISRPA